MRVLVCGSNYGATYIRALAGRRDGLILAGILSTGGAHSLAYAREARVPHFAGVDTVPVGSVDIACVAVPGEAGHQLALALLDKGIHVMCEHPIGPERMREALLFAQQQQRVFQVNAHFADLAAPQAFYRSLAVAAQVGPPLHLDLAVNLRTLYSGLDLVGRALGSLDGVQLIARGGVGDIPAPFATLHLQGPAQRISLLCQNFASAADDGSATLLNHRCSATFAHGNLLLAETNGPVLWFPSPVSMPPQQWRAWLPVETAQPDSAQLQQQRDQANLSALAAMTAAIHGQARPAHQEPAYLIALAALWEQVLVALQPGLANR